VEVCQYLYAVHTYTRTSITNFSCRKGDHNIAIDDAVERENGALQRMAKEGTSLDVIIRYSNVINACTPVFHELLEDLNHTRFSGHKTRQSNTVDVIALREAFRNGVEATNLIAPFQKNPDFEYKNPDDCCENLMLRRITSFSWYLKINVKLLHFMDIYCHIKHVIEEYAYVEHLCCGLV
jgi:hypothetical protein